MKVLKNSNGKVLTDGTHVYGGNMIDHEVILWHQCPEAVRNYLTELAENPYNPSDYSTTSVTKYAPKYQNIPQEISEANSKPIGYTVDGVTFYDNEPNVAAPFAMKNKAGTLTAIDRLRWCNTTCIPAAPGARYPRGYNTRDLGGWSCDGGTVKYGMLVRGGEPNPADRHLMVDVVGIRTEVQLLPVDEQETGYVKTSAWGIDWAGNDTADLSVYSINDSPIVWKKILSAIFDSVTHNKPVYFHCGIGADRTGIIAIILEGILGVSQSDIDTDYELTDFAFGWYYYDNIEDFDHAYRSRSYSTYRNIMSKDRKEINGIQQKANFWNIPLVGGLTDTFRNHCISFVISLGFTVDEINAFRTACINGNPEQIVLPSPVQYAVTKNGDTIGSVDEYQGFEMAITPEAGQVIESVTVTMGGAPINAFSGEKVNLFRNITNNLINCTTNNNQNSCIDDQGYAAKISADSDYTLEGATVSITIGGVEMSTNYYKDGMISIPSVTGDVVISITAVAQGQTYTNLSDPLQWASKKRIHATAGSIASSNAASLSNAISVVPGDVIRMKNCGTLTECYAAILSSSSDAIGTTGTLVNHTKDGDVFVFNISASGYFRQAMLDSELNTEEKKNAVIITRNEEIT